jgi:hypothetical protein
MTAGMSPKSADEVNLNVGFTLRAFSQNKTLVNQYEEWLASTDLKVDPYNMSPEDETLIKSAIGGLDTTLDTVDMTFISRLIGLPT